MRTLAASAFGRLADWAGTFRISTLAESAAYWFYHWLGTFDVSLAFLFFFMFLMALYMLVRCLRRMRLFAALSLTLQLTLLTIVALVLYEEVLVIPAYEMLFIFGGVFLPSIFLLRDYAGMKRRVRVSCGPVPLVEKRMKRQPGIVPDGEWLQTPDAPGTFFPADRVGKNLESPDASILANAREQLREADELIAESLFDEADGIYTILARIIPLDAAGYCNAGWLKHRSGDQEEAVRLFRKALSVSKKSEGKVGPAARHQPAWFARFGMACAFFSMKDYEEALFDFQKASVAGGDTAGLLRNLARCHLLLGFSDKAREEMEKSLELEDSAETRLTLARLFEQLSLREGVVAQLERLTSTEREMPAAWRMLGTLYRKEENWGKAEPCFARLVKLEPDDSDAWFRLGTCNRHLANPDAALDSFRMAIRLMPDHSRALYGAAAILEERREMKDAVSCLNQSLAGNEQMEKTYNLLAGIHQHEGRIREAVSVYGEAVSRFPESGLLQANLGSTLVMAGFHERALKPLKTAIRLGENDPSIYTVWVKALFEVKHAHEAVRVLRDAVAAYPGDAGLCYLSARAKARCHDTEGAIADLEAAVAIDAEMRLEARSCAEFSAIRTAPGFIDLIRLPLKQGR